jgi:hypothetical protein
MRYSNNNLQALGECLGLCETRGVDPRIIARLLLDVVAYDSEVTVPVGYLALPEPPAEDDHGKPGEPWVYADLPPEPSDSDDSDDDDEPRERDERGRKVITRDHSWRDKTLATVRAAGTSGATVEALAAQLQVSGGALQMRLARLRRDGLVERINRSWRVVEVAS